MLPVCLMSPEAVIAYLTAFLPESATELMPKDEPDQEGSGSFLIDPRVMSLAGHEQKGNRPIPCLTHP